MPFLAHLPAVDLATVVFGDRCGPVVAIKLGASKPWDDVHRSWRDLRKIGGSNGFWPLVIERSVLRYGREFPLALRLSVDLETLAAVGSWPTMDALSLYRALRSESPYIESWFALFADPTRTPRPGIDGDGRLEQLAHLMERTFGERPTDLELSAATGPDGMAIRNVDVADLWMHHWSVANVDHSRLADYHTLDTSPHRYPTDTEFLVLLPHGLETVGAIDLWRDQWHTVGGLFRQWNRKWGAQPVRLDQTSIYFDVRDPPLFVDDAIPLAVEHAAVGPWDVHENGKSLYQYAYGLIGANSWRLTDKP